MGNQIDWAALPVLVEMVGVDDIERLVGQLNAIKQHLENKQRVRA